MSETHNRLDAIVLPSLLRAAREVYRREIPLALSAADFEDVPANGTHVLGALRRANTSVGDIIKQLGITKQAAGQLFDTLVLRGYLTRTTDPHDRRRMILALTERGEAASLTAGERVDAIERGLTEIVGLDALHVTKRTLIALVRAFEEPG